MNYNNKSRQKIWHTAFIIAPAVFYLVSQVLLRLLITVTTGHTLGQNEANAFCVCISMPIVVFLYEKLKSQASKSNRMIHIYGLLAFVFISLWLWLCFKANNTDYSGILELFCFCIAAPVMEEIIYRGFVLQRGIALLKPWQAILLSSMLFAVAHQTPSQIMFALFAGIVFSILVEKTGLLIIPMIMHMIWNAVVAYFI